MQSTVFIETFCFLRLRVLKVATYPLQSSEETICRLPLRRLHTQYTGFLSRLTESELPCFDYFVDTFDYSNAPCFTCLFLCFTALVLTLTNSTVNKKRTRLKINLVPYYFLLFVQLNKHPITVIHFMLDDLRSPITIIFNMCFKF